MSSVNKVIIVGNLGADPESKSLQDGTRLCNLRVATSEHWKDKQSGERRERTEWHRVTVWGNLADVCERYLHKGSKIYLEGQLQTRKWQDQSGADRYSTEIILRGFNAKMVMLDSRGGDNTNTNDANENGGPEPDTGANTGQSDFARDLDDEVPF